MASPLPPVQSVTGGVGATASVSLPSPATAGNLLFVAVSEGGTTGTLTMTAPAGMNARTNASGGTGTTQRVLRLFDKIAAGGEQTFTISAPASGTCIVVLEIPGIDTVTPLDVENAAITAASLTHATPAVTPTASAERLVLFSTMNKTSGTWSTETVNGSATGVTEEADTAPSVAAVQVSSLYVASTIAGTYTGSATVSSSAVGAGAIAIYRVAAVAHPPGVVLQHPPQFITI